MILACFGAILTTGSQAMCVHRWGEWEDGPDDCRTRQCITCGTRHIQPRPLGADNERQHDAWIKGLYSTTWAVFSRSSGRAATGAAPYGGGCGASGLYGGVPHDVPRTRLATRCTYGSVELVSDFDCCFAFRPLGCTRDQPSGLDFWAKYVIIVACGA